MFSFILACSPSGGNSNSNQIQDNDQQENGLQKDIGEDNLPENENEVNNDDNSNKDEQSYMEEKLANSYFREIDVEIKYENGKEYEFEIDNDEGFIKAKLEDDLERKELRGIEAFDLIFDQMEPLNISHDSSFDDVTNQIIKAFNLPDDYIKVDVEIKFHDGTELDYESVAD